MAKISVIVPIYGVEKYLQEAIDSILAQTLSDLEIILIDDGSKDKCPQIIDEYAKQDSRIITIHKENGGYGSAMNIGLEKATGEYIAILEPDDYIDANMYEDLYKIAKEFDSDIVKSGFYDNLQTKEEKRIIKVEWKDYIPENRSFTIKEYPYFLSYHPSIWSCIYKRDFLEKHNIRFVEAPGSGWADNPFQVQTMCLAERINYTSKAYYYWRRKHQNESDDLKDYTIPFKRSDEIHQWLNKNGITDEGILINLFRREISYAAIVLGMRKISNIENCLSLIKKLITQMDKNILQKLSMCNNQQKKLIETLQTNPLKLRKYIFLRKFRQKLISIRWKQNNKRVIVFGSTIWKG